jgi:SAM-dependent methyltransferase
VLGRPVAGLRLLNVGCGTGGFNVCAAKAGAIAWGVDASAEATALAAERVGRARICRARAEALPFPSGRFDLVYCYSTLEHVQDAACAIREMVRVLRSGGLLYLHTPSRWACFESHYKVFWPPGLPAPFQKGYLRLRGRPTAFLDSLRLLSLTQCRRLVEAAGARVARVLDDGATRPVGGALWPVVRLYYRLLGIHPYVELLAARESRR